VTGQIILHYEVKEALGQGGMGVVYKALDLKLNRLVALKFLAPDLAASAEARERSIQEATALSLLNHPHIATLFDIEEVDGKRFLVLEYLAGGTLKDRLEAINRDGHQFPIEEMLDYARQTAEGLAHAHRRGIIHRDLKTSNLMLTEEGQLKITDFGIAKLNQFGGSTAPGTLIGTPRYMSPEQAEGSELDSRSDIFSLGVVLFELTTGRLPFQAESRDELLLKLLKLPAPALSAFRSDVPAGLEAIVAKMMMKHPSARYQTADDLKADLQMLRSRLLERTRSLARKPTGLRAWNRRWMVATPAAALVLAGSAYLFLSPWPVERRLAVLPFRCSHDDRLDESFCNGLFEVATTKLSELDGNRFIVISPREVIREQVKTADEARKAFAATLALTAALKWSGEKLGAMLEVLDATKTVTLGSGYVEVGPDDLTHLPDLIAKRTAAILKLPSRPEPQASTGLTSSPKAFELYMRGRGFLQRHDRSDQRELAIRAFDEAVQEDPQFALAHAGRAEAYLRVFKASADPAALEQARTSCQRALTLNDQLSATRLTMGMIHRAAGEYQDAIISFESALKAQPDSPDAFRELGNAYAAAGRTEEAEATFLRAIRLRPDDWNAYRDLGVFYYGVGRLKESVAMLKRVTELTPDNYEGYRNLGGVYLKKGDYHDAELALRKSLELRPTEAAYSNFGTLYYFRKQFAEAAKAYQRATELNPEVATGWVNLGDAYRWVPGKENEAAQAYRRAIPLLQRRLAINDKDAQARAQLATVLSSLKESGPALIEIKRALETSPNDGYVVSRAVLVYEQAGMREQALGMVPKAIESNSLNEIESWPSMEPLRHDLRYVEIVKLYKRSDKGH